MRVLLFLLATAAIIRSQDVPEVMIEGAVDIEIKPFLSVLRNQQSERIGAWTYWTGSIGKHRVVIARTDVGPTNAAAATALGISRFHPRAVIDQGIAGAHDPSLNVFDLIVGESTVDYGAVRSEHGEAGSGISVANWVPMDTSIRVEGGEATRFPFFAGDGRLMTAAKGTPYRHGRLLAGRIGSAFQYNRQIDYINWLHATFKTESEDMESAFAAATSKAMGVPFLAVRIISNSEFNHPKLERNAAQYCGEFVIQMVEAR